MASSSRWTTRLTALLIASSLIGCSGDEKTPKDEPLDTGEHVDSADTDDGVFDTPLTVDPRGFTLPSGVEASLEFDTTTLASWGLSADDLTAELIPFDDTNRPGSATVTDLGGALIRLGPEGLEFPEPLVLSFNLSEVILGATQPRPLAVWWDEQESRWEPIPADSSDDGVLHARIAHFSDHAILGAPGLPSAELTSSFSPDGTGTISIEGLLPGEGSTLSLVPTSELGGDAGEAVFTQAVEDEDPITVNQALDKGIWRIEAEARGSWGRVLTWSRSFLVDDASRDTIWTNPYRVELQELIQAYLPVVQFAEDEEWLPLAFDTTWFGEPLELSSIGYEGFVSTEELVGETAQDVLSYYGSDEGLITSRRAGGEWTVSTAWAESNPSVPGVDDIVVYASLHQPDDGLYYIGYWFFYLHDSKGGSSSDPSTGAHDRDRESITVVVDPAGIEDPRVIYAGHMEGQTMELSGYEDSAWTGEALVLEWDEVDRVDTHPVAYVASGSHALYPRARTWTVRGSVMGLVPWAHEERAGGGLTYCPEDSSLCLDEGGASIASGTIVLDYLPPASLIEGDDPDWRHLLFPGRWVDGAGWYNGWFPPFLERYHSLVSWIQDAEVLNAGSGIHERLGAPNVLETQPDLTEGQWASVENGTNHACAIRLDGSLWCWGSNSAGQLGDGTTTDSPVPVPVSGGATWSQVAIGDSYTCGIQGEGTLWCWGSDWHGALGNGLSSDEDVLEPELVGMGVWSKVSAAMWHACGVQVDGSLWCWGEGYFGRLGTGSDARELEPAEVDDGVPYEEVCAGGSFSCGIRADQSLWCWGSNSNGELGTGGDGSSTVPVAVDSSLGWDSVACGYEHACAIATDGTLWCWGRGGVIGDGTSSDRSSPVEISGGRAWLGVTAGTAAYAHSCAVDAENELWCWGFNSYGELGDGTTSPTREMEEPVETEVIVSWEQAAAGTSVTCAVTTLGRMWCWGLNEDGQVGDGTTRDRSSPVEIGL